MRANLAPKARRARLRERVGVRASRSGSRRLRRAPRPAASRSRRRSRGWARGRRRSRRPARSRPPRRPSATVVGLMPPSTWMSTSRPRRSISARSARIFGTTSSMNFCPEKPGLTVISSTMSRSASTGSTTSIGDAGRSATAAFFPSERMCATVFVQVGHRLDVHVDEVGARARERLDEAIRLDDHQVEVERQRRRRAERLHDRRADRDVRDELAVHHVDVNHVGARHLDRLHLFAQSRRNQRPGSTARYGGGACISGGTYINDGVAAIDRVRRGVFSVNRASGPGRSCRCRPRRCR